MAVEDGEGGRFKREDEVKKKKYRGERKSAVSGGGMKQLLNAKL